VRIGVIGRGYGEGVVAPAFRATDGCEVVDVVSPRDGAAVTALCGRDDVDLISVHSPPFLHLDNVRRAVEAGHDVLCDKPFGRNAAEAAEMRDLAQAAGVLHFLNFETRYDAGRRCLRTALADGVIGEPEHVAVTMLMSIWRTPLRPYGWLFDADAGGGWLRSIGSHQIDFIRWTFGEFEEVDAQLRTAVTERSDAEGTMHPCTSDDGFVLTLRSGRGVSIVMNSSADAPLTLPPSTVIVGSRGILEEAANRVVLRTAEGERELFSAEAGTNPLFAAQKRYAEVVRDAVHERQVPADAPTFEDGLACVGVLDRALAVPSPTRP
jgi:predicted dehydrogenase